jgi:hypothetical protein
MRKASQKRSTLPTLPSLLAEPPPEAQRSGKVVRGTWRDPTDTAPSASRTAKEIKGWRQPCMLRWCRARFREHSKFTAEHVAAADELRRNYDLVRIGASGRKSVWIYIDRARGPKLGPSAAELANFRAWQEMKRVRHRFTDSEWALLGWFILESRSIGRWVQKEIAAGRRCDPDRTSAQLVRLLDTLAEHFNDVIRRHGVDVTLAA